MKKLESPDIDRGWAFVVMLSGTLSQLLTIGCTYSTGIFYTTFLEEFNESPVMTAWTVNLNVFVFYLTGELTNMLVGLVGTRLTIVIACCISTAGLLACYFANSLVTILVMYGVVTGIGFSSCYFPVFAVLANYFRKYRIIAFGVASAGSGAGQFFYAFIIQGAIEQYHWRGAFLILAAINLNMLVIAAALMPPRIADNEKLMKETSSSGWRTRAGKTLREQARYVFLFRNPRWTCFCLGLNLLNIGISGFLTHIVSYGRILGLSIGQAAFLPSVIGIGGIVGRIASGIFGHFTNCHVAAVYIIMFSLIGVVNIVTGLIGTHASLVINSFFCGVAVGAYAIYPEVVIHLVGVKNLSAGISYSTIFAAMGMLTGGPLAALLYESDTSYLLSFIVTGLVAFVGTLFNLPSWITVRGRTVHHTIAVDLKQESLTHDVSLDAVRLFDDKKTAITDK